MVTMNVKRITQHLLFPKYRLRSLFNADTINLITLATKASERRHSGQICFAVEGSLSLSELMKNEAPRNRAIDVFSQLRVWDTECNNGVLIYVLLADKAVEIIADRGVNKVVDLSTWADVCKKVESNFSEGDFRKGSLIGIESVGVILENFFACNSSLKNEIPDSPILLD